MEIHRRSWSSAWSWLGAFLGVNNTVIPGAVMGAAPVEHSRAEGDLVAVADAG